MKRTGCTLGFLLAVLWAGLAGAEAPAAVAAGRAPEIRLIEAGRDAPALRRIEYMRGKLPAKYQRRNNFAWAVAKIDGLDKTEYFSHSGIKQAKDLSAVAAEDVAGISLRVKKGRFTALCVNHDDVVEGPDCFPRHVDTEYKILEDMATRLPDPAAGGRVRIYTDLYPCASCRHVMGQFLGVYTNVRMQVLDRER